LRYSGVDMGRVLLGEWYCIYYNIIRLENATLFDNSHIHVVHPGFSSGDFLLAMRIPQGVKMPKELIQRCILPVFDGWRRSAIGKWDGPRNGRKGCKGQGNRSGHGGRRFMNDGFFSLTLIRMQIEWSGKS